MLSLLLLYGRPSQFQHDVESAILHAGLVQTASLSSSGVRAKLVAREIAILQRELHTKAVVYIMGRAHVHMRAEAKTAFDWCDY